MPHYAHGEIRDRALALVALSTGALAQTFPNRPVTLTVGFAPGGGTDTAARVVAQKLSENIGQSVVVENRTGAGGNIAAQHIATAPPDGYTIHLTSVGPMSVAPHFVKDLTYDPRRDIAPITMGVMFPNVLVVHAGLPAKNLSEFVALAKQSPGKLSYGSSGVGGAGHLAGELFKERAGINMLHVPYKGGGPAMTDLLGGRIDAYLGVPSTVAPHVDTGKFAHSRPPARSVRRRCRPCRRSRNRGTPASRRPTGTRSWRPARRRVRSSTTGTARS